MNYPQHLTALALPEIIGKITCSLNSAIQRSMDRRWWCNKSGRSVTDGTGGTREETTQCLHNSQRTIGFVDELQQPPPHAVIHLSSPQCSPKCSPNNTSSTTTRRGLTFRAWQMQLNSGNPRGRRVGKWDNALVGILLSHSHSPRCPRLGTVHVAIMQWGGHFYSYRCRARPIFSAPNRLRHCVKVVLILNEVRDRIRNQTDPGSVCAGRRLCFVSRCCVKWVLPSIGRMLNSAPSNVGRVRPFKSDCEWKTGPIEVTDTATFGSSLK